MDAASLSRSLYVASRVGRSVALRAVYVAYARTLARDFTLSKPAASSSLRARLKALFDQDFRDAEAGLYPRALITSLPWREYALAAPLLLADLPRTRARIRDNRFEDLADEVKDRYPRYYARNFHFQTDGYLGHDSARIYDLQVEFLFGGSADAMRRRLIPPVVRFARGHGLPSGALPAPSGSRAAADETGRPLRVLDVACGTGRLLSMLGAALPDAAYTGVDLSPHYVAHARSVLPRALDLSLLVDNAEALPFPAGRFDVVTCLFLFHELPRDVGQRVLAELSRVVRPGGLVVLADSLQLRDAPELDHELRSFPDRYHEPYYLGFIQDDLAARARESGLAVEREEHHFLTKVVTCSKPVGN